VRSATITVTLSGGSRSQCEVDQPIGGDIAVLRDHDRMDV
jgi:hypothetical protein